jgi:hypothetical protein
MSSQPNGLNKTDTVSLISEPGRKYAVHLPSEMLLDILSFVKVQKDAQKTLSSCCLVSRSWYSVAIVQLYHSPIIEKEMYGLFIRTMFASNSVPNIQSPSKFVRTLDMRNWPHVVHERVTIDLLEAVEEGLEVFIGPDMDIGFS